VRTPWVDHGLGAPLSQYSPPGFAFEALLVPGSSLFTEDYLLETFGDSVDTDLLALIPEDELRNGMPLAKASLVVGENQLVVARSQNVSSRAGISAVVAAEALQRIKAGAIYVPTTTDTVGGGPEAGVLVADRETGVLVSLEGNKASFAEKAFLQDHHTSLTGTAYHNLKLLYKWLQKKDEDFGPEDYLQTTAEERQAKLLEMMTTEWPSNDVLKSRKMILENRVEMDMLLQREWIPNEIMSWLQQAHGLETVVAIEESQRHFLDEKSPGDRWDNLGKQTNFAISLKTDVAEPIPNKDEYAARADSIVAMARAKRDRLLDIDEEAGHTFFREAEDHFGNEFEPQKILFEQAINELKIARTQAKPERPEAREEQIAQATREELEDFFLVEFDLVQNADLREGADWSEQRRNEKMREYGQMIARVTQLLEVVGISEKRRQEITLIPMDQVMERDDFSPNTVTANAQKSLVFLRYELDGLVNRMLEAHLGADLAALPIYPHKVRGLVDKDATLTEPGEPLTPEQSRNLIGPVIRGFTMDILTGATPLEAWEHVFVPSIEVVHREMQLPDIIRKVVYRRMQVLANDGSSLIKVDTVAESFQQIILGK